MRVKDEMTQNAIGVAPRAKLRLAHDIALEAAEPQIARCLLMPRVSPSA
jgi:hypothetical protein